MGTLSKEVDRKALAKRLRRVTPEARAQWGAFDVSRMMRHVADALDVGLGRLPLVPRQGPAAFRHFPLKHLALYVVPMPKSAKAPPQLLAADAGNFEQNRFRILEGIEEAARTDACPEHFLFGRMTVQQWNRLHWKHIDHHLRQFGC